MKVGELLEKLKGVDPESLVLIWTPDEKHPDDYDWRPLEEVDVKEAGDNGEGGYCMSIYSAFDPVPAVWLG